ncbi:MAG: hypothetical protein ACPGXK_09210 [Phycisphaerae bacterium]
MIRNKNHQEDGHHREGDGRGTSVEDRPHESVGVSASTERQAPRGSAPDGRVELEETRNRNSLPTWKAVSFWLVHRFLTLVLLVTGLRGLYLFSVGFGTLEWSINYKRRRKYRRALNRLLPGQHTRSEQRRITLKHFQQARCDKVFYLILDQLSREQAASLLTIDQKELLHDCIDRERGVYIAFSHHGSIHVIAALMSMAGYKTAGVRDKNEGPIRVYVQRRLDRRHGEFQRTRFMFNDAFPREIYRCFEEGYMLASAMDASRKRNPNQKSESVQMFGEERELLTGPLHVAFRCKSPMLQAFAIAEPNFRYRLHITGMLIDPDKVTDRGVAISEAIEVYARTLEQLVREQPALITRP